MRIYIAQTRTRRLNAQFAALGWGAMHCRGRLDRPRLDLWAYDNGAYVDWTRGREFDEREYLHDLERVDSFETPPAFCVLPDIVAQGLASLRFSMRWLDRIPRSDWYLAVQDGMTPSDIPWGCGVAGIFVGGDTAWKLETMHRWVREAHRHGLPVHVGRMGTPRRVNAARMAGVDSIDSSFPLWTSERMNAFVQELVDQGTLW